MCFDIALHPASFVRDIVVPPAVASVVVIAQNERIDSDSSVLGVFNTAHAVEVLANLSLDDLVLLTLKILVLVVEVKFVVSRIGADNFCLLHVKTDRQNTRQGEVRVFDVVAVDFFIDVEKVGVLELLDGFVGDLARPVVHAQASVLKDHLLQIVELVTTVVVGLHVLEQLSDVFALVHDLLGLLDRDQIDHHFGGASLLHRQQGEKVVVVDFVDESINFDIVVQVLSATAAGQMHELLDVLLASGAEVVVNSLNVNFFQEALRGILKFTDLHRQLLDLELAAGVAVLIHGAAETGPASVSQSLFSDSDLQLLLCDTDALTLEAGVDRVVVDDGTIKSDQIKTARAVGMLEVWWEEELENGVKRNLVFLVLKRRRAFRDLKQENVSLFVGFLRVVRAVQGVHDNVFSVLAAETVRVLFGNLRLLVSKQLLPAHDRHIKLDLFEALGVFGVRDLVNFVDEKHDDRLSGHHMLLNVGVVGGVSVRVKQVEHLFARQNLAFFVEDLKVVLFEIFVQFVNLRES